MIPTDRSNSLMDTLSPGAFLVEVAATFFISDAPAIIDMLVTRGEISEITLPLLHIAAHAEAIQARQVLLLHTHPSGDPRPSAQDITVTRCLCGKLRRRNLRLVCAHLD